MLLAKCFDGIIIHNKEMILVKKLLFVALILLCVVPAVALTPSYMAVRGDRPLWDVASRGYHTMNRLIRPARNIARRRNIRLTRRELHSRIDP
jgi:hypothetical protein